MPSICEAAHPSRTCRVTSRRRQAGPWVYSAKRNRPRIRHSSGLGGVDALELEFSPPASRRAVSWWQPGYIGALRPTIDLASVSPGGRATQTTDRGKHFVV